MSQPTIYQIRIKEQLDNQWAEWFSPLVIHNEPTGDATLTGPIRDQAQLMGILLRLHDLNISLLAVNRIQPGETTD
jgi:hypothetical protein